MAERGLSLRERLGRAGKPAKRAAFALLFLLAAFLLAFACRAFPFFADRLYRPVSRALSWFLAWVFSPLPLSAAELLLAALAVGLPVSLVVFAVRLIGRPGRRARAADYASRLFLIASCLVFSFYFFWGGNYSAASIPEERGYRAGSHTGTELKALAELLSAEIRPASLRAEIGSGTVGWPAVNALGLKTAEAVGAYTGFVTAPPKPVLLSVPMSYANITGIYSPFTGEANVNADNTAPALPFTMAHEMMHRYGAAREEEANFLAFAALYEKGDDDCRYSALFMALEYVLPKLYTADKEAYAALVKALPGRVRDDMTAYAEHWKKYETPVARISSDINNSYLKSQGQSDGVKSYGRMVDLLLSYFSDRLG